MSSTRPSFLFVVVNALAAMFMALPMTLSLWLGRRLGWFGYSFLAPKRMVVYSNLKTVFSSTKTPAEIRTMTRQVFVNFAQSAVEFLCLPKISRMGFDKFVDLAGKDKIDAALARGRGVVFLAIHSGSWELASIIGGVSNGHYHIVVNEQSKMPDLDKMLNEYRAMAGAHVITTKTSTKDIVKAMQDNEIVSLVVDQGGRDGVEVPFLGKSASMSNGAMRLALKYGSAVCPVWMERGTNGKHTLTIFEPISLISTGDLEKDIAANVRQGARHFEGLLMRHPTEYMWFYKVFKYSSIKRVLLIDDGRTGHLRQSQSVARHLREVLKKKDKSYEEHTVTLQWRSPWAMRLFPYYAGLAQFFSWLAREDSLRHFLTEASYQEIMKHKTDYVISCGSQGAGVNFILSHNHLAKSISILTPGTISKERFHAVIMPQHDNPKKTRRALLIIPKVSPNLISPAYLKEQSEGLMKHYSHLRGNARTKFGVLIGGDAKGVKFGEAQIRQLMAQIKEAALHYKADILLTTSRRTPPAIEQIVAREMKNFERCSLCILANQRNIPEAVGGILELSDLVIVSGESISMISEAITSAKRTIVFSPNGRYGPNPRDKYESFVLKLHDQGYLMISSVDGLKPKITQMLSYKIAMTALDDRQVIQKGLEAIA